MGRILLDWVEQTDWMPRIHPRESYAEFAAMLCEVSEVTLARETRGEPGGEPGRVLGFIARQDEDVQALYVAGFARRRGVGKALLEQAKACCARLGLWTFQANTGARRFYRREGFREDRRTDGAGNDEKLPDVHLAWERAWERADHG